MVLHKNQFGSKVLQQMFSRFLFNQMKYFFSIFTDTVFLFLVTQVTSLNGKDFLPITTDCGRHCSVTGLYRKHTQPARKTEPPPAPIKALPQSLLLKHQVCTLRTGLRDSMQSSCCVE